MTSMRTLVRPLAALAALGGLALLTGCTNAAAASWQEAGSKPPASVTSPVAVTSPADAATNVPTATEIAFTAPKGAATTVALADSGGGTVAGALRPDGSSWVPAEQLKWGTAYTATVTSGSTTKKVSFTTMARPGNLVRVSTPMGDGVVYGVAMPLVFSFGRSVPKDQRAAVERRLFVTSTPAQVGTWNWFSDTEVHYRTKDWWEPGTKFSVRMATGGLSFGGNAYGANDLTIEASIGEKLVMSTDNATHTMTVSKNDQVLKTIPISLGKPAKPSSSGNLVVMTKNQAETFSSTDPGDSYSETVYWTQRLTWGGQYIHAAPWSVNDQGRRNVSHGCTNMSTENAKWLFGLTHVGDPYTVKGTGVPLTWGDGWTDWNVSWDEYLKGSALPPPAAVPASPAPSAS
jgi:lipoprotein-anchoring transpeptidase ErfK/SrfK